MLVDFDPPTQANSFPDQCIDILNQPQDQGPFYSYGQIEADFCLDLSRDVIGRNNWDDFDCFEP